MCYNKGMANKTAPSTHVNALTIEYPDELLWALQQEPEEFAAEARLLLALKLYETGKLSTGLSAQVAGIPRSAFFYELSRRGLSPFGETPDELEDDLAHARRASHSQ
jgi:predicted HTH domain antitoxin